MIVMNKRFFKITMCLGFLILSFFVLANNAKAVTKTASAAESANVNKYKNYKYKSNYWKGHTRYLEAWIFYTVNDKASKDEKKVNQAYCIEQDQRLVKSFSASSTKYPYDSALKASWTSKQDSKITLLARAMSVGYKIEPSSDTVASFKTAAKSISAEKAIAKQEIIWEIFSGTRTNFSIKNNCAPKSNCTSSTCPFYYLITNNSKLTAIKNEYVEMIKEAHYVFEVLPESFGTGGSTKKYNMEYDATSKKFTKTLTDKNRIFKYFTFNSSSSSVEVKASATGDKLVITSSVPIDAKNPVIIVMTNKNVENGITPAFYNNGTFQDVGEGAQKLSYSVSVSTPYYQLKINKTDSLHEDKPKPLKGAVFSVCSDIKCSKVLKSITTNDKGVATYDGLDKPGTYYVKETKAPDGYDLDSTIRSVKVTTDNEAGTTSYATINIKNKSKEFNLIKKTIDENGEVTVLNDGCDSQEYTGPEFEIKNSKGDSLYFTQIKSGEYELSSKENKDAVSKIKTCNGKFKVYTLPECNYEIIETKAPDGLILPTDASKKINVCGKDKTVTFTNGFTGVEFQKKDEDGTLVPGGKFSLQKKTNNVYEDMLLKQNDEGNYEYVNNLKDSDEGATYIILTDNGIAMISKLPPGEYRVVEKEAPDGYEIIKDKDSKALLTITDSNKDGYYLVEMINHKTSKNGSSSFAELIITIITGRKVPNYIFIISSLVVLLVLAIILRKKIKK